MNNCLICDTTITLSYWLCSTCSGKHGGSYRYFPEWLREMIRMERRWRYDEAREADWTVPDSFVYDAYHVEPWDEDRFRV